MSATPIIEEKPMDPLRQIDIIQEQPVPQDLHIHTNYSSRDPGVVPEQTLDLIRKLGHARVTGISDHFECMVMDKRLERYIEDVRAHGFHLGTELLDSSWLDQALEHPFEYYVFHTADEPGAYAALETLLETGKPVIVPHPGMMGTDLNKVPTGCLVEISNRYAWRGDWRAELGPHVHRFKFVLSSDAHHPTMLNQRFARSVARELGVQETLVFPPDGPAILQ
jgi:hypothetical protein